MMNSRQKRTLRAIFEEPTRADIKWSAIESLLKANGAERFERKGSRVIFVLNGVKALFHRPHPSPDANKSTVRDVREFLRSAEGKR
jgi:hypothetical protein